MAYYSENSAVTDRDMKDHSYGLIGFDLGKVSSQVCITEDGELIERRIKTDREHLSDLLNEFRRSKLRGIRRG